MATDKFTAQAGFKKLFGLVHTEVKDYPLGNESLPSQLTIVSSDIYIEIIPETAGAVTGIIIACDNATPGQINSYLTVAQDTDIAPDDAGNEGHPYLVTVPAGHGLIGKSNPFTGGTYSEGDIVNTIIPKKFGASWRPFLYSAGPTEIGQTSSVDWYLDERGFVIIITDDTPPTLLKCWVYIGKTLQDFGSSHNDLPGLQ